MTLKIQIKGICVKKTHDKGRGVFALKNFKKGETIEQAPVIVLSAKEKKIIMNTELFNHYFNWGKSSRCAVISMGYGSIYNHSWKPNAKYVTKEKDSLLIFKAIKDIKKGEEICTSYNGDAKDKTPYFFRKNGKLVKPI
jgi:uncharacterized protein